MSKIKKEIARAMAHWRDSRPGGGPGEPPGTITREAARRRHPEPPPRNDRIQGVEDSSRGKKNNEKKLENNFAKRKTPLNLWNQTQPAKRQPENKMTTGFNSNMTAAQARELGRKLNLEINYQIQVLKMNKAAGRKNDFEICRYLKTKMQLRDQCWAFWAKGYYGPHEIQ